VDARGINMILHTPVEIAVVVVERAEPKLKKLRKKPEATF
jgi:hypothetical protein